MADISSFFSIFALFLLCFLGALWKALSLKKENRLLAEQLTETSVSLERTRQKFDQLQEKYQETVSFQNSLDQAELTAKLTKPMQHDAGNQARSRTSPERYGYIHSLTEKGLSTEEIASILTISTHEARQLVTLSKIAHGNE